MKKEFIGSVFFLSCFFLNCNNFNKSKEEKGLSKAKEEEQRRDVLKMSQEIAFREYGDIIKNELPLRAKLVGDSLWIIEGTLPKGSNGGTVYIEIRKSDNKVLKITHYK